MDSKIELCQLEPACGCQVSRGNPGLGLLGHCAVPELAEGGSVLHVQCNTKAWAGYTTTVDFDTELLPLQKGNLLAHSRVLLISTLLRKPTNPFNKYLCTAQKL